MLDLLFGCLRRALYRGVVGTWRGFGVARGVERFGWLTFVLPWVLFGGVWRYGELLFIGCGFCICCWDCILCRVLILWVGRVEKSNV